MMPTTDFAARTDEIVAQLSRPDAYASRPARVRVVETHMAWVFLAGRRAYKLEKPRPGGRLAQPTLAQRERHCRREVRLNRRLAARVYLGVVPVVRTPDRRLAVNAGGRAEAWLVEMERLPATRMLDGLIRRRSVTPAMEAAIAGLLAGFYEHRPPEAVTAHAHRARLAREIEQSHTLLAQTSLLPSSLVRCARQAIDAGMARRWPEVRQRVCDGRIVEGHGDLRPEHICALDPPVIIDCLELSRTLRLLDPFDDLAVLTIECDRLGARGVGTRITRRVARTLGDRPSAELFLFYQAFRAYVRARLAVARLGHDARARPAYWRRRARLYLDAVCRLLPA